MPVKYSTLYFFFQSLKYAKNLEHFKGIWKYNSQWKTALQKGYNSMADEQAWLNFEALDFLKKNLVSSHNVFEYGGGGSTLFFLNRVSFVATVENDQQWFQLLSDKIKNLTNVRWQGFFQEGELVIGDDTRQPANPQSYMSNTKGQENLSYEKYAKTILLFPENYFDVVLVDGRARPSCLAESISRLKQGGLLVVDNMERTYYHTAFNQHFAHQFVSMVDGYYPTPYHPEFTITKIWRKK